MKYITKNNIIGLIIVASITLNVYYFGTQWFNKVKTTNFNSGILYTFRMAKDNGEVQYKLPNGEIIQLIVK